MTNISAKQELLSIHEAAALLKVSTKTLRRWEAKGILVPERTEGKHRRYRFGEIISLKKNKNAKSQASLKEVSASIPVVSTILPTATLTDTVMKYTTPQEIFSVINNKETDDIYKPTNQKTSVVKNIFAKGLIVVSLLLITASITQAIAPHIQSLFTNKNEMGKMINSANVLADTTSLQDITFNLNVPTNINADLLVGENATISGNLIVQGPAHSIAGILTLTDNQLSSVADLSIAPLGGGVRIGTAGNASIDLAGGDLFVQDQLQIGRSITLGGDSISDFVGTGLSVVNGTLQSSLGIAVENSELTDSSITEAKLSITNDASGGKVLSYGSDGQFTWVDQTTASVSPFQTTSNVTNLVTSSDDVTIGTDTDLGKLAVVGDSDEVQLLARAYSTQTSNIFAVQNSSASNLFTIDNSGNITLATGADLTIGTIGLNDLGSNNTTSGANLVGVFDEFTNSSGGTLQSVLKDFDSAMGAGSSKWTDGGAITYLTSTTDDIAIGASNTLVAPFSVDVSANLIRIGTGATANAQVDFYASDGDTGSLIYNTSDQFAFSGGDVRVQGQLITGSTPITITTTTGYIDADAIQLITADGTGSISSASGLEVDTDRIGLIQGCADGEVLKWNNSSSMWECATDTGASFAIVDVQNNDASVGTSVDTIDFSTDFSVTASPSNEANVSIADDVLNFSEFSDALTLDAATSITAAGALNLSIGNNVTLTTSGTGSIIATNVVCTDCIALATETTGNYIATIAGNTQVGVSGSGSENAGVTLSINTDSITASELNSTLTFSDGDFLNLSAINVSSATEGIIIPQNATACSAGTADGQLCWDNSTDTLYVGNGATASAIGGGSSFTSFTAAGDTGSNQTISNGNTLAIAGGTNGIDTVGSATDTITLNLDTTEIGTTTFGSGSGVTWTFDASAGTDTSIAFGNNTQTLTAATVNVSGNADVSGTLFAGTADAFQVNSSGAITALTGFTQVSGVFGATLTTTNAATFSSSTTNADSFAIKPQSSTATNSFTGTLTSADLTANRTWTIPDATGTVCLDTGNCAGSGGGITGSGSTGQVAYFNGTGTITSAAGFAWDTTTGQLTLVSTTANADKIAVLGNSTGSNTFTGSITSADLTGNQTWTFPNDTGTVCLTTGNCAGVGGVGTMSSFTTAGDSGSNQTISDSNTLTIAGGTNGIDTVGSATDTITLNLDTTEIGTSTFGSGSAVTWTFDASAGTDTSIAFGNNTQTFTTGTATFTGAVSANSLTDGTATLTAGALTGVASLDTISTSATALGFAGSGTITSTGTSALTLDSGSTGTVNIGTGTSGKTVNIATSNSNADTVNIGSALDTVAVLGTNTITGSTTINGSGSAATNIGTGTSTGTITIGLSSGTDLALSDASWNITGAGAANFGSIGATTRGSALFTTLGTNGNVTLGDANTDTLTINTGSSGTGISFGDSSFATCSALSTVGGVLTCGSSGGSMSSFTAAGDSGSNQTISDSNTLTIAGGTNGIDTVGSATDTITLNLDTTEIGTTTFGSGSPLAWTFNAGTIDPTIDFNDGAIVINEGSANTDLRIEGDTNANLIFVDASADFVGIGTGAPAARLDSLSTTEQLRLSYDASNYTAFTTSSTGVLTIDPTNSNNQVTFGAGALSILGNATPQINATNASIILQNATFNSTSSTINPVAISASFSPSSGTMDLNALNIGPIISQTGTASGSYTALNVNVTETAVLGTSNYFARFGKGSVYSVVIDNSGRVGIGDSTPSSPLEVGDGTDSLQFSSVGDLTFVDANGAASITGPNGGALSISSANSQNLTLSTTTAGDISLDPAGAGDISLVAASGSNSYINITGLTSGTGSALCVDGSSNLVTCTVGSGGVSGSGTSGQIAFFNGANSITSESSGFGWDSTNNIFSLTSVSGTTSTGGIADINVTSGDATVNGIDLDFTQNDGATAGRDAIAQNITLSANDADGDVFGLNITANSTANAAAGSYESLLKLSNAENTVGAVTDGILFNSSSGTPDDITDAIDASHSNITNAINVGQNFILGDGIRQFSSSSSVYTFEDTSGNDLITFTDTGTTGDVAISGALTVADILTVNDDVDINLAVGENVTLLASAAPTANLLAISNNGNATTTNSVYGIDVNFAQGAGAAIQNAGLHIAATTTDNDSTLYGAMINFTNASSGGTQGALYITNENDAANATTERLLELNNLEATADLINDYINIRATATDTTSDAIDVSDAELFNALNVGQNFILGDGIRQFSSSSSVWTFEDTAGNDLATITDAGTTGDLAISGDLTVSGGDIVSSATANLLNTTSSTINFASAATTLNIADAAITGTIDLGGVTADGISTVNIATNSTSADAITIGNSNASTVVSITGGDDYSLAGTGVLTLSASAAQTTAIVATDTDYTNFASIGDNNILGTTAAIDFSNFDVATTGNITVAAGVGLDTNASGILTLGNTTATTVNIGGTAATAINLGAGGSLTRTIAIGTGTGADTINIGTGATGADAITIGNSASTTALNFTSGTGPQTFTSSNATGTTTASSFAFIDNSLTTGTEAYISSTSITQGKLLQLASLANTLTSGTLLDVTTTTTALTSGKLASFDWSPGSATTATGDLFNINIGANGTTAGNIFSVSDSGSNLFSVSETQITSSLPHQFTAAGDVSIAYDLQFTNQTSSYVKSNASLYIQAGESSENNNLTLQTFGTGKVISDGGFSFNSQDTLEDSTTPSVGGSSNFTEANSTNRLITNFTNGTSGQIIFIKLTTANLDLDCTGSSINCGTTDMTGLAANDQLELIYDGTTWNLLAWMDASANNNDNTDGVDLAEFYPSSEELQPADVVSIDSINPVTIKKANFTDGSKVIGIVSTQPGLILGQDSPNSYKVALAGRVPVSIDPSSPSIEPGDLIGASGSSGKAKKVNSGYIVGRALESWTSGSSEQITVFVNPIYVSGQTVDNSEFETRLSALENEFNLKVDSSLTATDSGILASFAETTTNTLAVLGDTVLSDTVVNGTLNVGAMTFNNVEQSINAVGVLKIQSLALGSIEFQGGLVSIDTQGNVVANTITASKYKVAGSSAGTETVTTGTTEIFVNSTAVTADSLIFITPKRAIRYPLAVTAKEEGSGFIVTLSQSEASDVDFDWFILDKSN